MTVKICFGDGRCIRSRKYYSSDTPSKFYKPFKCPHNCKLVKCYHCDQTFYPEWILKKKNGYCPSCLRIRHNGKMMDKLFETASIEC